MAYTTNPRMPRVRIEAVRLVRAGKSTREVARHFGYSHSSIVRWCQRAPEDLRCSIPTKSSRPHSHPNALDPAIVTRIVQLRTKYNRCAEVIHRYLLNEGIEVSLSSVKRTLDRKMLTKKRSPWKRYHPHTERPSVANPGDLVQIDTIHLMPYLKDKYYVYTLLDVHSRWAYARAVQKINSVKTVQFVKSAQRVSPFNFSHLQTDHGPEFSSHFSERIGIPHRHSRVRKPNDNGHLERFNRTLQEEFLRKMPQDPKKINERIGEYLYYYNNNRLHLGLNLKSPMQVVQSY